MRSWKMLESEIKLDGKPISKEELEEKKKNLGKDQIIRESSEGNSSYYTLTRMDD